MRIEETTHPQNNYQISNSLISNFTRKWAKVYTTSEMRLLLFVEILFAVRTITFRSIFLFKMHNGHALPHNFSLQQMEKFLPVSIAQMVVFTRIAKSYVAANFEK